jgi:hypothetical protein
MRPKAPPRKRIKPKRVQCKKHLAYVAMLPCCCCGRKPVVIHHLLRGDPKRGMGRKAGDDYTIPCCPEHHWQLHDAGDETKFLEGYGVNGPELAARLWGESHE